MRDGVYLLARGLLCHAEQRRDLNVAPAAALTAHLHENATVALTSTAGGGGGWRDRSTEVESPPAAGVTWTGS